MRRILKSKQGNIAIYLVCCAIVIAIFITMGIALNNKTKGSIVKSVSKTNEGVEYYINNISTKEVDDAGK